MLKFKNLIELMDHFKTEEDCINYLKEKRIAKGLECPYCESSKVYEPKNDSCFRCLSCKRKFSVRNGTIFESSNIPLRKWFMASYLLMAHKKGISSNQLAKDIGVTQKTAWFMLHRLRAATMTKEFKQTYKGTVQVDEAYIGGREGNRHMIDRIKEGVKEKAVVVGIVSVESKQLSLAHVNSAKYHEMGKHILDKVELGSTVITDESSAYRLLNRFYDHQTINHSAGEYVRKDSAREAFKITTNSIEGVFGLLKRGINGIYHWISKKHLQHYLNEFTFRFNTKAVKDIDRFDYFCSNIEGRLKYKKLISC